MLLNAKTQSFHHQGTDNLIKDWLLSRQALLVEYFQLSSGFQDSENPKSEAVSQFYDNLVDYLATSHFQVFETLADNKSNILPDTGRLYAQMTDTTDKILAIQDKYFETPEQPVAKQAISELGERLTRQIELEDCLVNQLYC